MNINGTDAGEVINGTANDDAIDAKGGNDEVHAGDGADGVFGGDGDDQLNGDGGADTLDGGQGNDWVYGGDGADELGFIYASRPYYAAGEVDHLLGGAGNDQLYAEPTFTGGDAIDRTVYMYGGAGDDRYWTRFSDQNYIFEQPGEGTDTIILMYRGAAEGAAFYMPANVENLQGVLGTRKVGYDAATGQYDHLARQAIVGNALDNYIVTNAELGGVKTPTGDMTILAGAGNDTVTSDQGNDVLFGEAGDDSLSGGTGIDTLVGGDGNDRLDLSWYATDPVSPDALYGGRGDDQYGVDHVGDIVFENPGEGDDLVNVRIQNGGWYAFDNIEKIWAASDTLTFLVGNALANDIVGGAGSELLLGGGGNDSISGNAGNDSIFGEDGADSLIGGDGVDYMVGGAGNDNVGGGNGADALYGEAGDDFLYGGYKDFATDIMVGGDGNDIIDGNSTLGDYDRMDGGAGNDTYYVDTPDDLTFEAANGGTDTVYATIDGAGYYLYANVENLFLLGDTPFGVGNELDNMVDAQQANGNPTLLGGAGDDSLYGNAGANGLFGEGGDDLIIGGAGNDVLSGGAGHDTFQFSGNSGGDVITDFKHGEDLIQIFNGNFASFADLKAAMHMNDGSTVININPTAFLVLSGVDMNTLTGADFGYSGSSALELPFTPPGTAAIVASFDPHGDDAVVAAGALAPFLHAAADLVLI